MINFKCRHYKAGKPCVFNKRDGSECPTCKHVNEFKDRILFIKLDAMGDVLRSASLLPSIVARHDAPYIAWLTRRDSIELVNMMKFVDEAIELSEVGLCRVNTGSWNHVYSLSNDIPSASIATTVPINGRPIGYYIENGLIKPSNPAAERWLEMAAFDRLKRLNRESYQRRMLAIIGETAASVPRPVLEITDEQRRKAINRVASLCDGRSRPRVAINVGAGGRWPKKMLTAEQIHHYVRLLVQDNDVDILLVGGAAEIEKADEIMRLSSASDRVRPALTESSVGEFVALLNEVDVLLCGDTLALHIATAIELPTVAVFGPTSAPEIEDFDGLIAKAWTPQLDCLSCYGDCTKRDNCMSLLDLSHLVDLTKRQLSQGRRA